MNNRQTGSAGENMGCAYIEELGMEVLARNWHFGHEEIDIIARDGDRWRVRSRSPACACHWTT